MRNFIVLYLCSILSCTSITQLDYSPHRNPIALTPQKATVKLSCLVGGKYFGHGSGVFISPSQVLTAAHVPFGCSLLGGQLVIEKDKVSFVLLHMSKELDLALLSASNGYTSDDVAPLATSGPNIGDDVFLIGFPADFDMLITTKGIVSQYVPAWGRFLTDGAITFGNSGGGAYNSKGELVGIASAMIINVLDQDPTYKVGIFISLTSIKEFLATLE